MYILYCNFLKNVSRQLQYEEQLRNDLLILIYEQIDLQQEQTDYMNIDTISIIDELSS